MIASKLSSFLNKAPVKEHSSSTAQQQSSARRRIRLVIIISSLPNQMQSSLQLTRRGMQIFEHQTPRAEGLLSLTIHRGSEPDTHCPSAFSTGSRRKAQTKCPKTCPKRCLLVPASWRCSEEPTAFPCLNFSWSGFGLQEAGSYLACFLSVCQPWMFSTAYSSAMLGA